MQKTWTEKLRERWHLKSGWQVVIILIVFACTGFSVLLIKKPLLSLLGTDVGNTRQTEILYYILIFPLYNVILLLYGFIFGQFHFFWAFEKRFFSRILSIFNKRKPV